MEVIDIVVEFENWCGKCKHAGLLSNEEPCNECLENPVNQNSQKPVKFEPKEGGNG